MYEICKLILPVKGSIVECGVFRGFSVMAWAKLSAILEPENLTRRVYGFDSFDGFPSVTEMDRSTAGDAAAGDFQGSSYDEQQELIRGYDQDRVLGHVPKAQLIRVDPRRSIPAVVTWHRHV